MASTKLGGQFLLEAIGENWNPQEFANPLNEVVSFWDIAFPHSVHSYTHNLPEVAHPMLEKHSSISIVKEVHVEANQPIVKWKIEEGN